MCLRLFTDTFTDPVLYIISHVRERWTLGHSFVGGGGGWPTNKANMIPLHFGPPKPESVFVIQYYMYVACTCI